MNTLANHDTALHNKIYAIEGKLINNHGHVVEVERLVFNLPTAVVHTPITAAILAETSVDPVIAGRSCIAGNTNTEAAKVRKICPAPHTLGSLFLNHETVT